MVNDRKLQMHNVALLSQLCACDSDSPKGGTCSAAAEGQQEPVPHVQPGQECHNTPCSTRLSIFCAPRSWQTPAHWRQLRPRQTTARSPRHLRCYCCSWARRAHSPAQDHKDLGHHRSPGHHHSPVRRRSPVRRHTRGLHHTQVAHKGRCRQTIGAWCKSGEPAAKRLRSPTASCSAWVLR